VVPSKLFKAYNKKLKVNPMIFFVDVINYVLSAIMLGVTGTWIFLIKSMWTTFRDSPFMDKFSSKPHKKPRVSIILPARNEEMFIEKCINSLLEQDYNDYEIIVIDDTSEDKTPELIKKLLEKILKLCTFLQNPNQKDGLARIGHVLRDYENQLESCYYLQMPIQCIHKKQFLCQ
jgi:cellulose synthase/poly-beta-1,6-N-acetylglucosamine synthase-like glycosyltransferase